jgi:hypothetical protein
MTMEDSTHAKVGRTSLCTDDGNLLFSAKNPKKRKKNSFFIKKCKKKFSFFIKKSKK